MKLPNCPRPLYSHIAERAPPVRSSERGTARADRGRCRARYLALDPSRVARESICAVLRASASKTSEGRTPRSPRVSLGCAAPPRAGDSYSEWQHSKAVDEAERLHCRFGGAGREPSPAEGRNPTELAWGHAGQCGEPKYDVMVRPGSAAQNRRNRGSTSPTRASARYGTAGSDSSSLWPSAWSIVIDWHRDDVARARVRSARLGDRGLVGVKGGWEMPG